MALVVPPACPVDFHVFWRPLAVAANVTPPELLSAVAMADTVSYIPGY